MMLVIVPFWTNFLVRTYAWKMVLGANGIISTSLMAIGLIDRPLRLLYTQTAVMIGLVYSYLPFMLLPIYANLEKFDHTLMEAAHDSGADNFWAFVRVMLPLSRPGIIAGSVLTFIPSISAYILSTILGGGKFFMLGDLITREFTTFRDWPFASAISITLMVMVSIGVFIYFRMTTEAERL
jgi:spermidine/putrescine transport system permease protein